MASGLANSQTKPNLNGVWKMDPARSDFSTGPVSESRLDKISLDGVNLKDTIAQKLRHNDETTYDMIYTIDGHECANHVRGNLVKSTVRWEGEELVIDSKVFALRRAAIQDRWSLSADGKTITLRRHMTGAVTAEQKIIFDRQ
jgi:protein-tyrosine-phosphatase